MAILGDWGTTRLRLFRIDNDVVVDRLAGPGIGQLTASPAETLAATVSPWRAEAEASGILLCGMAGSRNGLIEAPYASCPSDVPGWARSTASTQVGATRVRVAPGLSGANFAGRADVMRGEETQIFGAARVDPSLSVGRHLLVLPGTHSKWAELVDGRVERFHTFFTGELFGLLRDHSTLTRAGTDQSGRDEGFAAGLERSGTGLIASLFEARAAQLTEGKSLGWALGLLSGLLIGGEIAEGLDLLTAKPERLVLVGDPGLGGIYAKAAEARGVPVTLLDGDACALAGLAVLGEQFAA